MRLLAIDTATEACSVALWIGGEVRERFEVAPRRHTGLVLPMIEQLLAEAELTLPQLDLLAFGRGPGSFTGVRVATSMIQGIAFARDLGVVPVSTLTALAQGAERESGAGRVLAAIDARMGELYWSACVASSGIMRPLGEERLVTPQTVPVPEEGEGQWYGVGSGWDSHGTILRERLQTRLAGCHPGRYPHAQDVARLAVEAVAEGATPLPAEQAQPVYLRNRVVFS